MRLFTDLIPPPCLVFPLALKVTITRHVLRNIHYTMKSLKTKKTKQNTNDYTIAIIPENNSILQK